MAGEPHITDITTEWTIFSIAAKPDSVAARFAKQKLFERYANAVHRYACVVLGDQNLADDVLQDFALKVLRGDFSHASPSKGKFRHYLKTALRHMIQRHQTQRAGAPVMFPENYDGPAVDAPPMAEQEEEDRVFWRNEFINRAWERLVAEERHRNHDIPYDILLKYRYRHKPSSAEAAAYFSRKLGRPISLGKIRGARHEARQFLKKALMEEVAHTLEVPSMENIREELMDLGLHRWLDDHIKRRSDPNSN